jgi:hypothetical protein
MNKRSLKMTVNKRINWISAGKFFAIAAVIADHVYGYCYSSEKIAQISYFSVSLFVLLSGITSYISLEKHKDRRGFLETLRRIGSIALPYAAATALYTLAQNRFFDFRTYFDSLINFSASSPFYFVLFFIQLLIAAPVLFDVIRFVARRRFPAIGHAAVFAALCLVAVCAMRFTHILPVYGGGISIRRDIFSVVLLGIAFRSLSKRRNRKFRQRNKTQPKVRYNGIGSFMRRSDSLDNLCFA